MNRSSACQHLSSLAIKGSFDRLLGCSKWAGKVSEFSEGTAGQSAHIGLKGSTFVGFSVRFGCQHVPDESAAIGKWAPVLHWLSEPAEPIQAAAGSG